MSVNDFAKVLQTETSGLLADFVETMNSDIFPSPPDTRTRWRKLRDRTRWRFNSTRERLGEWIAGRSFDEGY